MKPPPCVVDRWAGGSLTRRPKSPFAVSWPRQLGESNVITITSAENERRSILPIVKQNKFEYLKKDMQTK